MALQLWHVDLWFAPTSRPGLSLFFHPIYLFFCFSIAFFFQYDRICGSLRYCMCCFRWEEDYLACMMVPRWYWDQTLVFWNRHQSNSLSTRKWDLAQVYCPYRSCLMGPREYYRQDTPPVSLLLNCMVGIACHLKPYEKESVLIFLSLFLI